MQGATDGPLYSEQLQKALILVERMGTQNNTLDIALDFKVCRRVL